MSKANLTVSVQGTTESDGTVKVINSHFEEGEAVASFIFKKVDKNRHSVDVAIVGNFRTRYFVEILLKIRNAIGEEEFLKVLLHSLSIADDEKKD